MTVSMSNLKTARGNQEFQLTEYAQTVIAILKKIGLLTFAITIPVTAFFTVRMDAQKSAVYLIESEKLATLRADPEKSTVVQDEWFKIKIILDTGGTQLSRGKAVLRYDQAKINLENVNFAPFAKDNSVDIDNSQGRAVMQSNFNPGAPGYFTGKAIWMEAVFSAKSQGQASFWFDCRRNASDDTNLIRVGGDDIVNCNNLGEGWFYVNVVDKTQVLPSQSYACGYAFPAVPQNFRGFSGPGKGEVTLKWGKVSGTTHYTVTYGKASRMYEYGSPNIGDTDQFVVKGLVPGQKYYFVITAVNSCASSGYTNELAITAGYGAITKTAYDTSWEKGFAPPTPPQFLPVPREGEEAVGTPSATATSSAIATPSAKKAMMAKMPSDATPSALDTQTAGKPWQRLDFWLIALGIALGGLFFIALGTILGRGEKRQESLASAQEFPEQIQETTPLSEGDSSIPPSPWGATQPEGGEEPEPPPWTQTS